MKLLPVLETPLLQAPIYHHSETRKMSEKSCLLDRDISRLIHQTFSHRTNQKNSLSSTVRRLIGTPKATLYDVLRELTAKSAMSRIVVVKKASLVAL